MSKDTLVRILIIYQYHITGSYVFMHYLYNLCMCMYMLEGDLG